jgi:hypothetical protein
VTRSVTVVATSYPRTASDWQGLFIKRLTDAMAADKGLQVRLWAPSGPVPADLEVATSESDRAFLRQLTDRGGIAHRLRSNPAAGAIDAASLLRRLRRLYRRDSSDTLHINWLQNALPLVGLGRKAVIAVLGTDFKLLGVPGMVAALRRVLSTNRCILAPNAPWMSDLLQKRFGDLCPIEPTNFGIDDDWFEVRADTHPCNGRWLCVTRVTEDKIGDLFTCGQRVHEENQSLDLVGPNQGAMAIPGWVAYHGTADPDALRERWFPTTTGLVSLSRHSEGRPQVMLEAMASGLPIVASVLPAHTSTVQDGLTGFLVNDCAEYQRAIRRLSSNETRSTMGAAAREVAKREFGTWQNCIARYSNLYAAL